MLCWTHIFLVACHPASVCASNMQFTYSYQKRKRNKQKKYVHHLCYQVLFVYFPSIWCVLVAFLFFNEFGFIYKKKNHSTTSISLLSHIMQESHLICQGNSRTIFLQLHKTATTSGTLQQLLPSTTKMGPLTKSCS